MTSWSTTFYLFRVNWEIWSDEIDFHSLNQESMTFISILLHFLVFRSSNDAADRKKRLFDRQRNQVFFWGRDVCFFFFIRHPPKAQRHESKSMSKNLIFLFQQTIDLSSKQDYCKTKRISKKTFSRKHKQIKNHWGIVSDEKRYFETG